MTPATGTEIAEVVISVVQKDFDDGIDVEVLQYRGTIDLDKLHMALAAFSELEVRDVDY